MLSHCRPGDSPTTTQCWTKSHKEKQIPKTRCNIIHADVTIPNGGPAERYQIILICYKKCLHLFLNAETTLFVYST